MLCTERFEGVTDNVYTPKSCTAVREEAGIVGAYKIEQPPLTRA